jgi:ABC-type arginine/histidine transport system permease subunit
MLQPIVIDEGLKEWLSSIFPSESDESPITLALPSLIVVLVVLTLLAIARNLFDELPHPFRFLKMYGILHIILSFILARQAVCVDKCAVAAVEGPLVLDALHQHRRAGV